MLPSRSWLVVTGLLVLTLFAPQPAFAASEAVQIYVPIVLFVCGVAAIGLVIHGYQRNVAERQQTLRAMVDKGMQIPPGLLVEGTRRASPRADLRRGVLLISLGVGIGLFLLFDEGWDEAALGLVPLFVGVGYLVVAKLEAGRVPAEPPAEIAPTSLP